ncbi:MAG: HNH endonuclease [Clostridia bacterium]|nr:HNH endonuclease [Clostridia bacterium]
MKNNAMVINRETAMSFWKKSFGKASKVKDFAGREMMKGAYNDRHSAYGWNLDHILPQSKGGKTTESNLICCHILTNDEKADKFPCFSANGKQFEIVKVENHYEIKEINKKPNKGEVKSNDNNDVNFYDSAAGISFYKTSKGFQNKPIFVGIVVIELNDIKDTAIIDFISEIYSDKSFSYKYSYRKTTITIKDYNMPNKADNADLLDRCILLNTYLAHYFLPLNIVNDYNIYYGVHTDKNKLDCLCACNEYSYNTQCPLIINELVKINTEANQKINNNDYIGRDKLNYNVYRYNYIYTKLAENLKKSIK